MVLIAPVPGHVLHFTLFLLCVLIISFLVKVAEWPPFFLERVDHSVGRTSSM